MKKYRTPPSAKLFQIEPIKNVTEIKLNFLKWFEGKKNEYALEPFVTNNDVVVIRNFVGLKDEDRKEFRNRII